MKALNEFLNEAKNYGTKVSNLSKKDLESTETLRDALQSKTKKGIVDDYEEERTMFGKVYPSRVSIFTYGSSPDDRNGSQKLVELFAKDGKLYLYGFRAIRGYKINDEAFNGRLRNETPGGLSGSADYFGTENKGIQITTKQLNQLLGMIEAQASAEGQAFADFYKGWKNPD